jgi:hypothetical protein
MELSRDRCEPGPDPQSLEDGAKDELPRAEAWLREAVPAITVRLGHHGHGGRVSGSQDT